MWKFFNRIIDHITYPPCESYNFSYSRSCYLFKCCVCSWIHISTVWLIACLCGRVRWVPLHEFLVVNGNVPNVFLNTIDKAFTQPGKTICSISNSNLDFLKKTIKIFFLKKSRDLDWWLVGLFLTKILLSSKWLKAFLSWLIRRIFFNYVRNSIIFVQKVYSPMIFII